MQLNLLTIRGDSHTRRWLKYSMENERGLLAAIAGGDDSALETLYDVYAPRLTRFLARMTLEPATVAELLNDVFVVIWQKSGSFRGEASVSTWIIGIAYRKGLKALARRKSFLPLEAVDLVTSEHEAIDRRRDLDRALRTLSPMQRAVMELTYYFGYSYKEIAEQIGCPESTVKTRMYYARRKLRLLMGADANEH